MKEWKVCKLNSPSWVVYIKDEIIFLGKIYLTGTSLFWYLPQHSIAVIYGVVFNWRIHKTWNNSIRKPRAWKSQTILEQQ